jgi:hypothetical protein
VALVLLCSTASGCAKLLGIEAAQCDPKFSSCVTATRPDAATSDAATVLATNPEAGQPVTPHQAACETYCSLIQSACTLDNAQYLSEESCLEICGQLMLTEAETSDAGLTTNNTIECRIRAARAASEVGEVADSCVTAGMWGNTECGEPCEVYCSMMQLGCPTQFTAFDDDCLGACSEVPWSTMAFSANVAMGNTLQCRINHIRLATVQRNPTIHCPHASGLGPCGP